MKRLLAFTVLLAAATMLAITLARSAGATGDMPVAKALSTGDCTQPCWHGIRPGATTLHQIRMQIAADPSAFAIKDQTLTGAVQWSFKGAGVGLPGLWQGSASTYYLSDSSIEFIDLRPPVSALRLGDAIAIFGQPVASTLCWRFDNPAVSGPFMGAHVYFRGNVDVLAYNPAQPDAAFFDPNMAVWLVTYRYSATEPIFPFDAPRWSGFTGMRNDPQTC